MKKIKASVLIANYNNQKYIKACIDSLIVQTHKNFEIIFHDDCSNDNSIKYVKKYKNIKIIKNKKRGKYGSFNQIAAYERAFNLSSGEIIFLLDSDDLFLKNKIETIIQVFEKDKKIKVIYDLPIILSNKKKEIVHNKTKIFKNIWPYIPPQSCISLRRRNFKKIIKKINIKKYHDIWMDFRIAIYQEYLAKNFFVLDENLTIYRKSDNNASAKFRKFSKNWWKRRLDAHNYVKLFFKKNNLNYRKNFDYYLTKLIVYFTA